MECLKSEQKGSELFDNGTIMKRAEIRTFGFQILTVIIKIAFYSTELSRCRKPGRVSQFLHSIPSHCFRLSKPPALRDHSRRDAGRSGRQIRAKSGSGIRQEAWNFGSSTGIHFGALRFRLSRNFCNRGWVCSFNNQVCCHWRFHSPLKFHLILGSIGVPCKLRLLDRPRLLDKI